MTIIKSYWARVILGSLLLVCALPGSSFAGGFSNADFGVRRMGMFAVIAKADDLSAIFHNPAGLTLSEGTTIYHSQSWFFSDLEFRFYDSKGVLRPDDHSISPDWSMAAIPLIAVSSDFGTEKFRGGLTVFAPNAYGAALPDDEATRYHATRVAFIAGRATAALAYEVSERFSIAVSASAIYVYLTAANKLNPFVLNDPDERFESAEDSAPYDNTLELEAQDWTWGADIGLMFQPVDGFRIGAVFASGSNINLEGTAKLTYAKIPGEAAKVEKTGLNTNMVIPFTLSGGINWEFAPDFEFGADLRYWHYQIFQEQVSVLDEPIMGIKELTSPKNYGNSWGWGVGLLHKITPELEIMTGYQEDYTPIPAQTYSLDNPSTDQRGVAVGLRWQATETHRFGLAFVRNWFDLIDVQESISVPPTNVKGWGANSELGLDWTVSL
jgi:long-chain fatty acid transport protein